MMGSSPGFTAVALVSLSLGICIAACAYSEMNGLLRDLPGVRNPDQLVGLQTPASYPNYKRYHELSDLFSDTFAYVAPVPFGVSNGGPTERTWGHLVTASYFSTLGVHPLLGRFFWSDPEQPAVGVSFPVWQGESGAHSVVLGKYLRVHRDPVAGTAR